MELGRTPKILPILTMVGYTFGVSGVLQEVFGNKDVTERFGNTSYTFKGCGDSKLGTVPSLLLALPIAGAINNFT